jgi:hypothetical protein
VPVGTRIFVDVDTPLQAFEFATVGGVVGSNLINDIYEQPLKAVGLIDVTVSGMVIDDRE